MKQILVYAFFCMFVMTNLVCGFNYNVIMETGDDFLNASATVIAMLRDPGKVDKVSLTPVSPIAIEKLSQYSFTVNSIIQTTRLSGFSLQWISEGDESTNDILVRNVTITPLYLANPKIRKHFTKTFCTHFNETIPEKVIHKFNKC